MKKRTGAIIFRLAVSVVISLSLLILSLHLYLKKNSSEIFRSFAEKLLNSRGSIYKIDHNSVDIDLLGEQVVVKNLEISFDEEKLKRSGLKKSMFLKASIPLILISGISISDLVIFHKISADRILLKKGKFKFYLFKQNKTKKKHPHKSHTGPVISLGGIVMEETDIEFFTDISTSPKSGLTGVDLDIGKVEFSPTKKAGKKFNGKIPRLKFNINNSFIFFKKSGYKVETGSIRFGSTDSSVLLKDFKYEPSSEKILRTKILQKGRYHHFDISEINLKNIDIKELAYNGRFRAGQLYLYNPNMYFFRNRNIRRMQTVNAKKLPQEIFRKAGLKVDIDLIRIKRGEIKYTEISPGERMGESLLFRELETSIHDVSNFPEILRRGKESEISISTRVMGKSLLKGRIMIPVNNKADKFSFSGSLAKTDPSDFNRFLKRNVKVKIDKGKINYMKFSVQADKNSASGSMKLSYNNLHLMVMRKKSSTRKRRFVTFLANTLTYKNNPTRIGRKVRTGKIHYKRVVKSSIFNYMWKCLLTGIKSSIKI